MVKTNKKGGGIKINPDKLPREIKQRLKFASQQKKKKIKKVKKGKKKKEDK